VGSIIGAYPELKSIDHLNSGTNNELKGVVIGNDVVIREYVQIHQGSLTPTSIGDRSFLMNQTYIAHDCQVGIESVLASSVLLAGSVVIGPGANLGMGTTVHQGIVVGKLSMVGMGSAVTRDVPNFMKVYGVPARIHGVNEIGMDRAGMTTKEINSAREIASKLMVLSD
jgi:UDP-N-acetylglucosamine acyltransferase